MTRDGAPASLPSLPAGLAIHRLADRPDLIGGVHKLGPQVWPEFMMHSACGGAFYVEMGTTFADCALVVTDSGGQVVCRALWIPFAWDGALPLPERGWDWVSEKGISDRRNGVACNAASALEIGILPSLRGTGLSQILLAHMRHAAAQTGSATLFAPVRPSQKSQFPGESMHAYLARVREDGLPFDAWLRVHVRAGGQILGACDQSMIIAGSVDEWQTWTGMSLSQPGAHIVPGALTPVESDGDQAVYTEPNVWVRHRLD
ncbi:MAG: N-acetyltransferase [Euzebya sp.]